MENITYFVTENFLKTNGIITSNVDVNDFAPLIQFASKAFVKKQIGSHLFDDLLIKYNNQTLSVDEVKLVEKMQWAISWRASAHSVLTLTYQLKNKGLQKQSDENSESVELKEAQFMFDNYLQYAILFESELRDYLNLNKELYPEFLDIKNNDSSIKHYICGQSNNYNEGIGFLLI